MNRGDAAREISILHARKPRRLHHAGEAALIGKLPDAVDQIAIRLRIPGNDAPESRNHSVRIGMVDRVEERNFDPRKFKAKEAAARLQDAEGLVERGLDARYIPDAERDGVKVRGVVLEGQRLGVGLHEADMSEGMLIGEAALAFFHHLAADVANNGLGARA